MARLALLFLIIAATASCSMFKRDGSASTGSTAAPTSKSKSSGTTVARGAEDLPASGGASAPKMESKRKVAEVDCSKPVDLSQGQGNIRCK
jgi:hypothetical protein